MFILGGGGQGLDKRSNGRWSVSINLVQWKSGLAGFVESPTGSVKVQVGKSESPSGLGKSKGQSQEETPSAH